MGACSANNAYRSDAELFSALELMPSIMPKTSKPQRNNGPKILIFRRGKTKRFSTSKPTGMAETFTNGGVRVQRVSSRSSQASGLVTHIMSARHWTRRRAMPWCNSALRAASRVNARCGNMRGLLEVQVLCPRTAPAGAPDSAESQP